MCVIRDHDEIIKIEIKCSDSMKGDIKYSDIDANKFCSLGWILSWAKGRTVTGIRLDTK